MTKCDRYYLEWKEVITSVTGITKFDNYYKKRCNKANPKQQRVYFLLSGDYRFFSHNKAKMTLTFYENNKYNLPIIGRPRFQLTSFVVQKNRWILRNSVASRKVSVKPSENLLKILESLLKIDTAQEMKFSINDFFSRSDQIGRKLQIWSHLLKKSLMENFIFCTVWIKKKLSRKEKYKTVQSMISKYKDYYLMYAFFTWKEDNCI